MDPNLVTNLRQYLNEMHNGGAPRNHNELVGQSPESILEWKLDKMIKRIDTFQKAESFNKITLREICDKYKELNQRRNNRLKAKEKTDHLKPI